MYYKSKVNSNEPSAGSLSSVVQMPPRKRASQASGSRRQAPPSSEEHYNEEEEEEVAHETMREGLRKFVEEFKGKTHRVVEMRIALACAFGVAMRLLFAEKLTEEVDDMVVYSGFIFTGVCFAVLIFTTWLDYFPTRLSDFMPRKAEGQGMPLGCLLAPTVCCACLHCSLYSAPHLSGLLALYLVLLSVLSFCSILGTLFHSIVFPNSVMLFNFAVLGGTYVLYSYLNYPIWLLLPAIALYCLLATWLLDTFPLAFTLAEVMIVSQGVTLTLTDTAVQLLRKYDLVAASPTLDVFRSEPVLYIEFLVTGVFICCLLLSPALYKLAKAKLFIDKKFWSGTFILLSLSVGFMLVLPWLGEMLGGQNAIALVIFSMFSHPTRIVLVVYWVMVCVATGLLVVAQSSTASWAVVFKASNPSSFWMRKWFHLSALAVFLPGLALDPNFISLACSILMFLFIVAELVRLLRMWPLGEALHRLLKPMLDGKDSGELVVSHIYLLLGFCLPLWLTPIRDYSRVAKLSLYSGVLAVGVGDAMAAAAGSIIARKKWPGTGKTVEGTLMSIMTQLLVVLLIILIDPQISFLHVSGIEWLVVTGTIVITAVMEAYTWQIDNLIVGLLQFALFIAFL